MPGFTASPEVVMSSFVGDSRQDFRGIPSHSTSEKGSSASLDPFPPPSSSYILVWERKSPSQLGGKSVISEKSPSFLEYLPPFLLAAIAFLYVVCIELGHPRH